MLKVCAPFPHLQHPKSIFSTPIFASVPLPYRPRAPIRRPQAQRLQLYESHATPKLYACFEKYSKPGANSTASVLAPIGSSFEVAFDHFKKFFKLKTGKDWDDRLPNTAPPKGAFIYVPPKEGQPRGVILCDGLSEAGTGDSTIAIIARKPKHEMPSDELAIQNKDGVGVVSFTNELANS